ncbi:MAG TPA: hypothetical protein PKD78_15600, partial [Saprospiraceae bacterium]|nr:hypothetical protein [Saprospiraceae bacterium]
MRFSLFCLSLLLSMPALPALAQKTSSVSFPARTETLWFADSAQHRERGVELGLALGGLYYLGDLAQDGSLSLDRWQKGMGGLYLRRRLWAFMALKAQALMGSMSSDDVAYPLRRSSFETSLRDISLQVEWEPWARRRFRNTDTVHYVLDRYKQIAVVNRARFFPSPYVFVGGGLMGSKATPKFDRVYSEASGLMGEVEQDMRLAGIWQNKFGLSFGGGVHLDLGKNWAFGLELSGRTAFSDYFDGISQAGNPERTDWYWLAAAQLAYRLGKHDRDGDGVADRHDRCPQIPGKGRSKGCPDADNDGI